MREANKEGFTMIEMLISVVLLGVMVVAVGLTSRKATDAYNEGTSVDTLNSQAHRAIERMLREIEGTGQAMLGPRPEIEQNFGSHRLSYRVATDWVAGVTTWGGTTEIELELEPGELDDGLDNDGDGLIDEGMVVLTQFEGTPTLAEMLANDALPGADRIVLCRGVRELLAGEDANNLDDNGNGLIDEPGLCFEVLGEVVTIRMTLDAFDREGRILTKTVDSSIWVRN